MVEELSHILLRPELPSPLHRLQFLLFPLHQFPELKVQSHSLGFGEILPRGLKLQRARVRQEGNIYPSGWVEWGWGPRAESSMGSLFSNSNSVIQVHWKWGLAKLPLKGPAGLQAPTYRANLSKPAEIHTSIHPPQSCWPPSHIRRPVYKLAWSRVISTENPAPGFADVAARAGEGGLPRRQVLLPAREGSLSRSSSLYFN